MHFTNRSAAYAAIGASGLAGSGYEDRMREVMVKEINDKGGIHGLKIKLVPYEIDQSDSSTPPDVHQQRMCTTWTQDDRVFAAFAGEGEVLDACLTKANVVEICGSCQVSTYDSVEMNKVPLLYSPNGVLVSRQVEFYVTGLIEGGYFTGAPGPPKVGFLGYDEPVAKRQFPRLEADLKARTGLPVAEKGFLPIPTGNGSSDAQYLNALQNYLLQFKNAGVNRIITLDHSGQTTAYGMQASDKNAYYPRWGLNSTGSPGGLHNGGFLPASQLPGLTVVGWWPMGDIGIREGTQWPPGLAACVELFKKHGMTMASDTDYAMAALHCDQYFFLRDALRAAPSVSVSNFGAGARSLGSNFKTAMIYGAHQGRGRRDGGENYRVAAYDGGCDCIKYVGPLRAM